MCVSTNLCPQEWGLSHDDGDLCRDRHAAAMGAVDRPPRQKARADADATTPTLSFSCRRFSKCACCSPTISGLTPGCRKAFSALRTWRAARAREEASASERRAGRRWCHETERRRRSRDQARATPPNRPQRASASRMSRMHTAITRARADDWGSARIAKVVFVVRARTLVGARRDRSPCAGTPRASAGCSSGPSAFRSTGRRPSGHCPPCRH